MWQNYQYTEESGSEGGIVIKDEEYDESCRITLERCQHYYAITCGVYGDMVHTAFCDENDCLEKYESMKKELENFLKNIYKEDSLDGRSEFYDYFCNKY